MRVAKKFRYRLYGLGMVGGLVGIAVLVGAFFSQAFTTTVPVTLKLDRAGLLMAPKNDVKLRGVVVGAVGDVRLAGDGAELRLDMDPDQLHLVPANVSAQILPATAFGNKFVSLEVPAAGARGSLSGGAVISQATVGTEVNTVFANLMRVMGRAQPSKVNATLDALATSLAGRGDQLGDFLVQVDTYLGKLNRHLPTLQDDLRKTATVANLYADIAPEFFQILDHSTAISRTLVDQQAELRGLVEELSEFGAAGSTLLAENGQNLIDTMRLLRPTSSLLARYAPGIRCFLEGENLARPLLERAIGSRAAGADTLTNILPGKEPYRYPDEAPQVNAGGGPQCYGLPRLDGGPVPAPLYMTPGTGVRASRGAQDESWSVGKQPAALLYGPNVAGGSR